MAKYTKQVFDPTKPLVARKTFKANGHIFKADTPFDWQRMALSQRKVGVFFDSGYLMHPVEKKKTEEPKVEPKVEPKKVTSK